MSLYAEYLRDSSNGNDFIIETAEGFATYRYLNEGKSVYIIDIFVLPEARRSGLASSLATEIVREASRKGAVELLGTVAPSHTGSTASLKFQLAFGMYLKSATNDAIILRKDI